MKKLTSIFLLLLFVWTVQAQTAREEIRANRYLSANNYYAYPTPTAKQTAAPKGYEPFYISTYMRHGSRYLIDPNDYRFPKQTLLKADSLNKLTATGKNTLDIVLRMADMAEGRLGELTSVGARQHRGIAKRMYTNFPQIFADGTEVDARSTVVIRCILSMTSECLQLQAINPNLCIKNDASYHDMYYMNPPAKDLSKIASSDKVKKVQKDFEATHVRPERLMKTLFTDEAYVKANVDEARLMRRLFDLACNMVEKLSEQWRAYDIFPMASNVQFVFFHKKGSNDVLVKVLLNEKETKLPVKTDVAPYYHWKDVESYYREKLDKYQHI